MKKDKRKNLKLSETLYNIIKIAARENNRKIVDEIAKRFKS